MPIRRRQRRGGKIIVLSAIVVLAAIWVTYWYGANQIGAAVLDRVLAAAATHGYSATCDNPVGGGFPFRVDLSCTSASLAGADGVKASVGRFSTNAALYRPWSIQSKVAGPLAVSLPAVSLNVTANWRDAVATINAGFGGLSGIAGYLDALRLDVPTGAQSVDGVSLTRAEITVAPAVGSNYRLSATARDIVLNTAKRGKLPGFDLDADLSALRFGDSLGLDPRRVLNEWIASGGQFRINNFAMVAGTVSARADGVLAMSVDGRLSGDLNVTIVGLQQLPDLLELFFPEARNQTEQIVAAAMAFTRPVDTPSGPARQMTLLIRDGVVSIGILPIGVIPPILF